MMTLEQRVEELEDQVRDLRSVIDGVAKIFRDHLDWHKKVAERHDVAVVEREEIMNENLRGMLRLADELEKRR